MKTPLRIAAMLTMAVLLPSGVASAYDYGFDPAKAAPAGHPYMYMELAQDPTLILGGVYAGKYEYFFDMYTLANGSGSTFYLLHLVGLDNSKIANKFQDRPDGGQFRTQRWGDRDLWEGDNIYEEWPVATGRILEMWSQRNMDEVAATQFDVSVTSYDDGAGGWTDTGFGYPGTSTANPHSYNEYVDFTAWGGGADLWKAELTGPGQPLHWFNTEFEIEPLQDMIYVPGCPKWSPPGTPGLTMTLRIVYDDIIDPATIGWSGDATIDNDILGDFTVVVPPPPPGDFDDDGDVDADDVQALCDNMGGAGVYDVDEDADVDEDDLILLIETLAQWDNGVDIGVGTKQGDFNLDGVVNATDLAIMKGTFGASGVDYADGNANCDTVVNATDLAILKGTFGFTAVPSPGGGVPEPATLLVMAAAGLPLLLKRKRKSRA